MIKYGEEAHLKQIIDGSLRFTPSQTYVKLEEAQHNKGQGDLLEGKMIIRFESLRIHHPETNKLLDVLPKGTVTLSVQDVSDIPIFCLSSYGNESIEEQDDSKYIVIDEQHLDDVKKDFPKATHALIILEPEKFINDVRNIKGHKIVDGEIRYFDYEINSLQMYMFLTTGDTELKRNEELSMTYKNRFRHLLCKDVSFENQKEYRFIGLEELIHEPIFYPFTFTSKYMLIPIDKLKKALLIE